MSETVEISGKPNIPPELIKVFCHEASEAANTLKKTTADGNLKLFTSTAHAMKSVLASIGENELSARAKALELAGHDADTTFIGNNASGFIKDLEELVEKLVVSSEKLVVRSEQSVVSSEDLEFLQEQLEIVKSACGDYDDALALEALDRIGQKKWNIDIDDELEKIRNAIYLDSNFEKAAELTELLISNY